MKKEKGKWVCFPTKKNWDNETEIEDGEVYFKHEEDKIQESFLGFKYWKTQRYAGQRYIKSTCWTKPFCIWQNENGEFYTWKWKEHPLTSKYEK